MKKLIITALVLIGAPAVALADHHGDGAHGHDHVKGHKKGHMMSKIEKMDTDGDSMISQAEYTAFGVKRFKKYDVDGDGKLSAQEMMSMNKKKGYHKAMKKVEEGARIIKDTM